MDYILKCLACGEEYSNCEKPIYRCEKCGGSLEIIYDYNKIAQMEMPDPLLPHTQLKRD